jgi:16S rRNA (guanine527-N7)-methyltransferase
MGHGTPLNPSLQAFAALLEERGVRLGLVGEGDREHLWERHVADSFRAVATLRPGDRDAYDLGSGGGLPGIVVAIARPSLRVTLVETQRRRVGWLELVIEELGLENAVARQARIEDLSDPVDVCFARALAPIERAWELARPLLRPGGRLVYFAGRSFDPAATEGLAADIRILEESDLESSGPLVIIAD